MMEKSGKGKEWNQVAARDFPVMFAMGGYSRKGILFVGLLVLGWLVGLEGEHTAGELRRRFRMVFAV